MLRKHEEEDYIEVRNRFFLETFPPNSNGECPIGDVHEKRLKNRSSTHRIIGALTTEVHVSNLRLVGHQPNIKIVRRKASPKQKRMHGWDQVKNSRAVKAAAEIKQIIANVEKTLIEDTVFEPSVPNIAIMEEAGRETTPGVSSDASSEIDIELNEPERQPPNELSVSIPRFQERPSSQEYPRNRSLS